MRVVYHDACHLRHAQGVRDEPRALLRSIPGLELLEVDTESEICCGSGSWGHDFYGVTAADGEPIIEKSCYSAFVGTDVEKQLRQRGIRTLVFAGVQTNVCVESSLRDAVCRGFHAVLASDCVASHTLPLHEATLNNVRFLFGDVLDRAAIMAAWPVEARGAAS